MASALAQGRNRKHTEYNMAAKPNNIPDLVPIAIQNKLHTQQIIQVTNGKLNLDNVTDEPLSICNCSQQCQRLLPRDKWKQLGVIIKTTNDVKKQNAFLQQFIEVKQVNFDQQRRHRVTYKYTVPILSNDEDNIENLLKNKCERKMEVCQRAFVKVFGISEKRLRRLREDCVPERGNSIVGAKQKAFIDRCLSHEPIDLSKRTSLTITKSPVVRKPNSTESKEKLASFLGISVSDVTEEMLAKYEAMVQQNVEKLAKKKEVDRPGAIGDMASFWDHVRQLEKAGGSEEHTLNNGAVTITAIKKEPDPEPNEDLILVFKEEKIDLIDEPKREVQTESDDETPP